MPKTNPEARINRGKREFEEINPLDYIVDKLEYLDIKVDEVAKFARIKARQGQVGEEVVTIMKDGHEETRNTVAIDEKTGEAGWIVTNPGGEEYIVPDSTFKKKYEIDPEDQEQYKPKGEPVIAVKLDKGVEFNAPWGEEMQIKAGGYLIVNGANDIYGIQEEEFFDTYDSTGKKPLENLMKLTEVIEYEKIKEDRAKSEAVVEQAEPEQEIVEAGVELPTSYDTYSKLRNVSDVLEATKDPLFLGEKFGEDYYGSHYLPADFNDAKRVIVEDFEKQFKEGVVEDVKSIAPAEEDLTMKDYLKARAMLKQFEKQSLGKLPMQVSSSIECLQGILDKQIALQAKSGQVPEVEQGQEELGKLLGELADMPLDTRGATSIRKDEMMSEVEKRVVGRETLTEDMGNIATLRKVIEILPERERSYDRASKDDVTKVIIDEKAVALAKAEYDERFDKENNLPIMEQVEVTKAIFQEALDRDYPDSQQRYTGYGAALQNMMNVWNRENPERYFGVEKQKVGEPTLTDLKNEKAELVATEQKAKDLLQEYEEQNKDTQEIGE